MADLSIQIIATKLKQPHLLHESVVGSELLVLSPRYPRSHAPVSFIVDAQAVKINIKDSAPSRSDVQVRANAAKWVKSSSGGFRGGGGGHVPPLQRRFFFWAVQ